MEIEEKYLRSLIRAQILFERFNVDMIPLLRISKCRIDVPDSWNRRKAALLAGDLADIYGIPGSFCTMLSAMIPGNYEESKKDKSSSDRESTPGEEGEAPEQIELLVSVKEKLDNRHTVFLPGVNTSNPNASSNIGAYNAARDQYKSNQDKLEGLRGSNNQNTVIAEIVDVIFKGHGNKSKVSAAADKLSADHQPTAIINQLINEAKALMKSHATLELDEMRRKTSSQDVNISIEEFQSRL